VKLSIQQVQLSDLERLKMYNPWKLTARSKLQSALTA